MRQTSLIAYQDNQKSFGRMEARVYQAIRLMPGLTDMELAHSLGFSDPNKVRPRRYELVRDGFVVEAGRRECMSTGRECMTWKVKR